MTYGVVCVQLAHFISMWLKGYIYSSCYYHHQIGSIHIPIVKLFFRGCVPEMFVTSYSVTYCIYVPGKPGICCHYHCAVYIECKYSDAVLLANHTRLFVQCDAWTQDLYNHGIDPVLPEYSGFSTWGLVVLLLVRMLQLHMSTYILRYIHSFLRFPTCTINW